MNLPDDIRRIIEVYAFRYFQKLRKPSSYELLDFESIGYLVYVDRKKNWWKEEKKEFFNYFFIRCLIGEYINILKRENRYISCEEDSILDIGFELCDLFLDLSREAEMVLKIILEPPEELKKLFLKRRKKPIIRIVGDFLGFRKVEIQKIEEELRSLR